MTRLFCGLIAALTLAFAGAATAQENHHAEDPIRTTVAFMEAFSAQDTEAMSAFMLDGAVVTFVEEQDGPDRTGVAPISRLIANLSASTADLEEPIWNIRGFEDGPVAVVTANFEFLVDGNRSHCGVNIFTLMRIEGEWKIATVTYSHITEGCDAD